MACGCHGLFSSYLDVFLFIVFVFCVGVASCILDFVMSVCEGK